MPRAFTQLERDNIRKKLIDIAADTVIKNGVKTTSIEKIVKSAHISKGAFYLFYQTKEQLIFEAIQNVQNSARLRLLSLVASEKVGSKKAWAERFILAIFNMFEEFPLLGAIANSEIMNELLRGASQDAISEEQKSDDQFFESVFLKLKKKKLILNSVDNQILIGIPRAILSLEMNRGMIGIQRYQGLKKLIASAFAAEISA